MCCQLDVSVRFLPINTVKHYLVHHGVQNALTSRKQLKLNYVLKCIIIRNLWILRSYKF